MSFNALHRITKQAGFTIWYHSLQVLLGELGVNFFGGGGGSRDVHAFV